MRPKTTSKSVFTSDKVANSEINHHWETFSNDTKRFILKNSGDLRLRDYIEFWSHPQNIESTHGSLAATLCGSSWYLAYIYLAVGKLPEAKSLILNGAFLQQCHKSSIAVVAKCYEKIYDLSYKDETEADRLFEKTLPLYYDGLAGSLSKESMESYLADVLPTEYRRYMHFFTLESEGKVGRYDDLVSEDWNSSPAVQQKAKQGYSTVRNVEGSSIDVIFLDNVTNDKIQIKVGLSQPLKSLFNQYADKRCTSLKLLRFTYGGSVLFLSSVGHKAPTEIGIKHLDVIHVSNITSTPNQQPRVATSSKKSNPKKTTLRRKKKGTKKEKNKLKAQPKRASEATEDYNIQHSESLSRIFEEAEPKFKIIRQKLNALAIKRTQPKQKTKYSNPHDVAPPAINPPTEGLGGKAGKSSFLIQVGEVENLYKTIKPSYRRNRALQTPQTVSIDLHGLTKEEALDELNTKLPNWIDAAMRGSYPWVIPVSVVCGGGNQILSEAVDNWIRQNNKVSKAPKGCSP